MEGKRTDLALEVRESFEEDKVEVSGVVLKKKPIAGTQGVVTWVEILNEQGSRAMNKPEGIYVTLESKQFLEGDNDEMIDAACRELKKIIPDRENGKYLIVGVGNREVTSDSLGPKTIDRLMITRQFEKEWGNHYLEEKGLTSVSALAPGVMGQTGMEPYEIIKGVVDATKPDLIIVIDALLARGVNRLCTTIQITDTGISPGAGVGNRRKELSEKTLGVPVIAIGVPTVVEAETILYDYVEQALLKQDISKEETDQFMKEILFEQNDMVMVTPKNIDEQVEKMSQCLAGMINCCLQKNG